MVTKSDVDQIVNNLAFAVEATPLAKTSQLASTSTSTPLKLKIKVRKKDESDIQHGVLAIPKSTHPNDVPERIRLISSDQTIMSFNVLMEAEFVKKPKRKTRKYFFGGCLGAQYDDDNDSYLLNSTSNAKMVDTSSITKSEEVLKQNFALSKIKYNNISESVTLPLIKRHGILGKCKPGGCLDPPFSEEKYSYGPVHKAECIVSNTSKDPKKETIEFIKKEHNLGKITNIKSKNIEDKSILSIYEPDPLKSSIASKYSFSIITYPPESSSSTNFNEKYLKNRQFHEEKQRKTINESSDTFYTPSKKTSHGKYSFEEGVKDNKIIYKTKPRENVGSGIFIEVNNPRTLKTEKVDKPNNCKQTKHEVLEGRDTYKTKSLTSITHIKNNVLERSTDINLKDPSKGTLFSKTKIQTEVAKSNEELPRIHVLKSNFDNSKITNDNTSLIEHEFIKLVEKQNGQFVEKERSEISFSSQLSKLTNLVNSKTIQSDIVNTFIKDNPVIQKKSTEVQNADDNKKQYEIITLDTIPTAFTMQTDMNNEEILKPIKNEDILKPGIDSESLKNNTNPNEEDRSNSLNYNANKKEITTCQIAVASSLDINRNFDSIEDYAKIKSGLLTSLHSMNSYKLISAHSESEATKNDHKITENSQENSRGENCSANTYLSFLETVSKQFLNPLLLIKPDTLLSPNSNNDAMDQRANDPNQETTVVESILISCVNSKQHVLYENKNYLIMRTTEYCKADSNKLLSVSNHNSNQTLDLKCDNIHSPENQNYRSTENVTDTHSSNDKDNKNNLSIKKKESESKLVMLQSLVDKNDDVHADRKQFSQEVCDERLKTYLDNLDKSPSENMLINMLKNENSQYCSRDSTDESLNTNIKKNPSEQTSSNQPSNIIPVAVLSHSENSGSGIIDYIDFKYMGQESPSPEVNNDFFEQETSTHELDYTTNILFTHTDSNVANKLDNSFLSNKLCDFTHKELNSLDSQIKLNIMRTDSENNNLMTLQVKSSSKIDRIGNEMQNKSKNNEIDIDLITSIEPEYIQDNHVINPEKAIDKYGLGNSIDRKRQRSQNISPRIFSYDSKISSENFKKPGEHNLEIFLTENSTSLQNNARLLSNPTMASNDSKDLQKLDVNAKVLQASLRNTFKLSDYDIEQIKLRNEHINDKPSTGDIDDDNKNDMVHEFEEVEKMSLNDINSTQEINDVLSSSTKSSIASPIKLKSMSPTSTIESSIKDLEKKRANHETVLLSMFGNLAVKSSHTTTDPKMTKESTTKSVDSNKSYMLKDNDIDNLEIHNLRSFNDLTNKSKSLCDLESTQPTIKSFTSRGNKLELSEDVSNCKEVTSSEPLIVCDNNQAMKTPLKGKQYTDTVLSPKIFPDQETITVNIGFQSYINDKKERIIKSIDTSKSQLHSTSDTIILIQSHIKPHTNEIRIPIDTEHDMCIRIKKTKSRGGIESKHFDSAKCFQEKHDHVSEVQGKKFKKPCQNIGTAVDMQTILNSIYEKYLIPLQKSILYLKQEVEMLVNQQSQVQEKTKNHTKAKPVRIIRINQRCGCWKKQE